jgi:serpin B
MKRFVFLIPLSAVLSAADSSNMISAMNAFTTESYRHVAQGDANLILSPFNIAAALSMALTGARGQTAEQIQAVLHIQYDNAYDSALESLLADVTKSANAAGNELFTANGLWVQKGFPIHAAFQKTLATNYHAPPTLVDFIANAEAARSQINSWTEEHTRQKIKNLFPAGSLNAQTRLVLTSAIYFYGAWQNPFDTSRTQPAPFVLSTGATTQAHFMNQTTNFGYTETPSAQILEMRYSGTRIAFDILLPKTGSGIASLEKSLTSENLTAWLAHLSPRNVQVSLPKFRAESDFSLSQVLSTMGMPIAFTGKADFSGVSSQGLAVSDVFHKAFVEVAEKGTEAAAATGISVKALAMHTPEPPVVFRADHPFLFLIRDSRSEVVLFIGRLTNPR